MTSAKATPPTNAHRVLVAGGGVGALEAALALRALMGARAEVTLFSPESHFTYRPLSVGEPFGATGAARYPLAGLAAAGGFAAGRGTLDRVDVADRLAEVSGRSVPYDSLIVATGARPHAAVDGALTFAGPPSAPMLARALRDLAEAGGRVAFIAPPGVAWTLPAYELALMTGTWAQRRSLPLQVVLATAESAPLEAMGPAADAALSGALADRGVELLLSTRCRAFRWTLVEHEGGSFPADLAIALPALHGPAIPGLPHEPGGYLPVDALGAVKGVADVYAVGDCAARQVKQGGLATQQADVAAAAIAHDAGATEAQPAPEPPVLRAMVMTGDRPLWLTDRPVAGLPAPAESGFTGPWWPPHKIAGRHLGPFLLANQHLQSVPETAGAA